MTQPEPVPGPAEDAVPTERVVALPSGRVSDHLRWLRGAVRGERLFAPRVAVLVSSPDGERVVVDERGELPWADLEIETSLGGTARGLLAGLGLGRFLATGTELEPVAALAGSAWWDADSELGLLAPVWVVVRATGVAVGRDTLRLAPARDVRVARAALARERGEGGERGDRDPAADGEATPHGDYIARIRRHIGHDRIFYPWAGMGIRDGEGRLLLVRHALLQQWHCPGGGMEIDETPELTAIRELREETALVARPGRLVGCFSRHVRAFPNGDRIQGVTLFLEGAAESAQLRPDPTGEIDDMGWFGADELPPLHPPWDARALLVLTGEGTRLD